MPKSSDGCLRRPGQKTAGVTLYLMEELGDARLRCDQLVRYLDEAVKLIEKSSHKDHFFEVAGHLIQSVPDTAFKLQKALQAVALAADRLDYEELKQELRPEKVEELEQVLKEVRIRPVQHRSEPGAIHMTPQKAAQRLREIAKTAREEGALPLHDIAALVRDLTPARKAHDSLASADTLEKMADAVEGSEKVGRAQLAALLSRIAMEAEFNAALKQASKPRLTQEMMQLGDVEEVKQKFKAENPDISDADLNEIAKQWQTNKDVVKDKTALASNALLTAFENVRTMAIQGNRMAQSNHWRQALMSLYSVVDEVGTILVQLGEVDTQKSEALKRQIRQAIPAAMHMNRIPGAGQEVSVLDGPEPVLASAWKASFGDEHLSKFEEGKPADPTENLSPEDAKRWKEEHEKNKDNFKAAGLDRDKIQKALSYVHVAEKGMKTHVEAAAEAIKKFHLNDGEARVLRNALNIKSADTADEARRSRFEEGKPADPTQNLNPADAKEWKEQHEKNKDNFKAAGVEDSFVRRIKKHKSEIGLDERALKGNDWKDAIYDAVAKLFKIEGDGKFTLEEAEKKARDWVKPSMLETIRDGLVKTAAVEAWKA